MGYAVIVSKEKSKRNKRDAKGAPSSSTAPAAVVSSDSASLVVTQAEAAERGAEAAAHVAGESPSGPTESDNVSQKAIQKAARKAQKHLEETVTDSNFEVELMPRTQLLPHEQVLPERLEEMTQKLARRDYFHKPILVDRESNTILDGHHKWTAAGILKLNLVPVVKVDYLTDERIVVEPRPESGTTSITKEEVVAMGRSESVYPPKSSRHVLPFELPRFKIPLKILR